MEEINKHVITPIEWYHDILLLSVISLSPGGRSRIFFSHLHLVCRQNLEEDMSVGERRNAYAQGASTEPIGEGMKPHGHVQHMFTEKMIQ